MIFAENHHDRRVLTQFVRCVHPVIRGGLGDAIIFECFTVLSGPHHFF